MRLLSLAAGTILDVDPVTAVSVASQAGFPAVGIWFDATLWNDQVAKEVASSLDGEGVVALDIEPIMLMPADSETKDHGDAIIDAAKRIGARNVLVASRDTDESRVASRLNSLVQRLEGTSIRLVLEFLPVLGIRSLPQALRIAKEVNHPSLGVLVDNLHLARAGHTPSDLAHVDLQLLPYLQICDAPLSPLDTSIPALLQEALHGRLLPGDGELPINELLRTVPEVPLSFELRSKMLLDTYPDPVERAKALLASAPRQ